jgi:hypothetical protein
MLGQLTGLDRWVLSKLPALSKSSLISEPTRKEIEVHAEHLCVSLRLAAHELGWKPKP